MINEKIRSRKSINGDNGNRRRKTRNVVVTILIAVVLLAAIVALWILVKPLEIRKITVTGDDEKFAAEAVSFLGGYEGEDALGLLFKGNSAENIIKGRLKSVENELKSGLPLYKNVTARIKFGGTLLISGEARDAFMPVDNGDNVVITDRDGFVVAICEPDEYYGDFTDITGEENAAAAVVCGLKPSLCIVGEKMTYETDVKWSTAAEMYFTVAANDSLAENVEKIFFTSDDGLYMYCKNGIRANFGTSRDSETLFTKLGRLSLILRSSDFLFSDGTIYLSDNSFDTFRPDKASADEPDVKIEIDH